MLSLVSDLSLRKQSHEAAYCLVHHGHQMLRAFCSVTSPMISFLNAFAFRKIRQKEV